MKNSRTKVAGALLGTTIAATGFATASYKLVQNLVLPNTRDYEYHYSEELRLKHFDEEWFHSLEKEEFYIESPYDYQLHGFFFPNKSDRTIIIMHGITVSLWSSVKYMKMFIDRGYNVVIYDQRNHGQSGGVTTSLGTFERMDGKTIVDYVMSRVYDSRIIGLHGESMGAATAMMVAEVSEDVDFVIEDCGFTSAFEEAAHRLKVEYKLPRFPFMFISETLTKKMYGFSMLKDSPLKAVKNTKIPILFIHGDEDNYVPTFMARDLYNVRKDNKEIHIFEGSKHAASMVDHPLEYVELVNEFLDQYEF